MKVEIVGMGCAKCHKLHDLVTEVAKRNGLDMEIVKVEDVKLFSNYGVFITPALVVNGEVKVAGKMPKESEILEWIKP